MPGSLRTDVCVVGAGIAGLTTAYLLAKGGRKVVVVDEKPVGGGETGRTSAHLSSALDDRFTRIERLHGRERTRLHYESHAAAIDLIERIDREEDLQCDFARLDGYLFLADGQPMRFLERERAAADHAGATGVGLRDRPGVEGAPERPCLRFPNQARFHPLKYLNGLAGALERSGVEIYCGSRVMDLRGDGPVKAKLRPRAVITADVGVAATNIPTPINNWVGIYTKEASYRTYVIAMEIPAGSVADALYWDFAEPYHYVRLHRAEGKELLLVGGEDHKTGQPDEGSPFDRLAEWARAWFPMAGEVVARWSGQVNEPDDGIAFIGRAPTKGDKACYVITGDSGMGLTHGTLGAMLVSDLVLGRENPWADLYDPSRKQLKAAGTFIAENLNAAAHFADYVTPGEAVDAIPTEGGAVVRRGLAKHAAYRDADGRLFKCSAVCPHLKGIVRWNNIEKSWDCPLHGSRFAARGELINGPSTEDLKPV